MRTLPAANIRAAAALLSAYANELGVNRADLGAWAPAAAKYSGISSTEAQAQYVHNAVYDVLRKGVVAQTPAGDVAVSLMPSQVEAKFAPSSRVRALSADYAAVHLASVPQLQLAPGGD